MLKEKKMGIRDSVMCNQCDWKRKIQNAFSCTVTNPALWPEAVDSHYVETGHYNSSYPVESEPDVPMLTEQEIAIGRAYRKGVIDGRAAAAASMSQVIRSLKAEVKDR